MKAEKCPFCSSTLTVYPRYFYCFRCSKQFRKGMFGRLVEVPPTIESDQRKALGRRAKL